MVLPEYTEKEELIRGYLERDEPLPADVLDGVLGQLWSEEPFKSRGFVLDGFPNSESEATFLVEKGYLPDAVIMLRVDEEQIVKRLLPPRLAKWQARMAAKREKKRLKALRKRERLMKRMKERRDEENRLRRMRGQPTIEVSFFFICFGYEFFKAVNHMFILQCRQNSPFLSNIT